MSVDVSQLKGQIVTDPQGPEAIKKAIPRLLLQFLQAALEEERAKKEQPLEQAQGECS